MTLLHRRVTGGVDTHKDFHVAAALNEVGKVLDTAQFPATPTGYKQLHRWLASFGEIDAVGVEGTGAWGAGLTRHLTGLDVRVVEVTCQKRQHRRRHGKSDIADAIGAARQVLSEDAKATPKNAVGEVEAIRMLQIARRSAIKARTQAANQLHAVIVTAPDELRARFAGLTTTKLADQASRLRPGGEPIGARAMSPAEAEALARILQRLYARPLDPTTPDVVGTPAGMVSRVRGMFAAVKANTTALREAGRWLGTEEPDSICDFPLDVFGRGDPNLMNCLSRNGQIVLVDWEYSGRTTRWFELADVIEHVRSRQTPDDVWRSFTDSAALTNVELRSFETSRRLLSIFWLLLLQPDKEGARVNPPEPLASQETRVVGLL